MAGTPLIAMPSSKRSPSSVAKFGAAAQRNVIALDAASEMTIGNFRPSVSESEPATKSATASAIVVLERTRLAVAGSTANSRANAGSSGCTS